MVADVESAEADKARRFRQAALPHLDDVYTLARYLLRSAADADDAVQECYLRAFRHFDGLRGQATKPWLMAILRNVCRAEYARRSGSAAAVAELKEDALPLWQEPENSPETEILRQRDSAVIRDLVAALPEPFREAIVLREHRRSLLPRDRRSYRRAGRHRDVAFWRVRAACCARHGCGRSTRRNVRSGPYDL